MQNAALVTFLAAALVLPTAEAASFCDKYGDDIRALVGESNPSLSPLMSVPSGARDARPRREVGCEAQSQPPSGRAAILVVVSPESDAQLELSVSLERYARFKPDGTPDPSLGPEGFSILTTFPPDRGGPNYLLVLGHKKSTVVRLHVNKRGTLAQREFTSADMERGKALVKRALHDSP